MIAPKTENVFVLSRKCHIPARCKKPFLAWYSRVEKAKGRRPTIAELVKEMRRKGSPLQGMVEQGQAKAAEAYWRNQAQYFLRHVEVVRVNITTKEVLTEPVCAYVPLLQQRHKAFDEAAYVPTGRITAKKERLSVVEQAHADFESWLNRFERYAEFLQEFQSVVEAYRKLQRRLQKTN
jgi:hypothetical protein